MSGTGLMGLGIGAGMVIIGAAFGIGKLAAAALDGAARQPEIQGKLNTQMLIAAALIEGVTVIALGVIGYGIWVASSL